LTFWFYYQIDLLLNKIKCEINSQTNYGAVVIRAVETVEAEFALSIKNFKGQ